MIEQLLHRLPVLHEDVIEAGVYRDGQHITFIDTAGIRNTNDMIEKEGIQRSEAEAFKADLVLLIIDASRSMTSEEELVYNTFISLYTEKIVIVYTKSDLERVYHFNPIIKVPSFNVSIYDQVLVAHLIKNIDNVRNEKKDHRGASPYLLNQRHYRLLQALQEKLIHIQKIMQNGVHYEILSHNVQGALAMLAELTGKSISEAAMDAIFRQFCVGK